MNNDQYWQGYINRIENIEIRDQQHLYTSQMLDLLSHFKDYDNFSPSLDIGPGWIPIIVDLHSSILSILPNYTILQIKEKFGGLRYYIVDNSDYVTPQIQQEANHLIRLAEQKSFQTCELFFSQTIYVNVPLKL